MNAKMFHTCDNVKKYAQGDVIYVPVVIHHLTSDGTTTRYIFRGIGERRFRDDKDTADTKYVNQYILPETSIFQIMRMIENITGIHTKYQYLWMTDDRSDTPISFANDLTNLLSLGGTITDDDIRRIEEVLIDIGFDRTQTDSIIAPISANRSIDSLDIIDGLDIVKKYYRYQCLTHRHMYRDTFAVGQWNEPSPIELCRRILVEGQTDTYASRWNDIQEKNVSAIELQPTIQNRVLRSFIGNDATQKDSITLYLASVYDISALVTEHTQKKDREGFYKSVLLRYFPKLLGIEREFSEPESRSESPPVQRKYFENVAEIQSDIHEFLSQSDRKRPTSAIDFKLVEDNMIEAVFHIGIPEHRTMYLRDILNTVRLSSDIPFVRYYDRVSKQNKYKLFREAFVGTTADTIQRPTLEMWFNSETHTLSSGKFMRSHERPYRSLAYRIRVCNQITSIRDKKPAESVHVEVAEDERRVPHKYIVFYKDGTVENHVEEYLIERRGGKDIYVYKHTPLFMEVVCIPNVSSSADDAMPSASYLRSIKVRCVFELSSMYHESYLSMIQSSLDRFIGYLGITDVTGTDLHNICAMYKRPYPFTAPSSIVRMASFLHYEYKSNFKLGYDSLRLIFQRYMYPYFAIVEPLMKKDTEVLYYANGRWNDAVIENVHSDGTYDVIYKGKKAGGKGKETLHVKNVSANRIRMRSKQPIESAIHVRYKRVSNYRKEKPILEMMRRLYIAGNTDDEVRARVFQEYDIDNAEYNELSKYIAHEKHTMNIRGDDNAVAGIHGVDVSIYLYGIGDEEDRTSYRIVIDHCRHYDDYAVICDLLKYVFERYYEIFVKNNGGERVEIENVSVMKEIETHELVQETVERDEELDRLADELDMDLDLDEDLLEFDDDEVRVEAEEEAEIQEAERETPSKPIRLSAPQEYETAGKTTNTILEALYRVDKRQFQWEGATASSAKKDKDRQRYTVACQPSIRYPKTTTTTTFDARLTEAMDVKDYAEYGYKIDTNKLPFSSGLGSTYLLDKDKEEQFCRPDEEIGRGQKCVSIVYGSVEDQSTWQNVFMCPKIWCVVDKIPLHPRHLLDGENRNSAKKCRHFVSKADITAEEQATLDKKLKAETGKGFAYHEYKLWRECKTCGDDIVEHAIKCPLCKSGIIEEDNVNFVPTLNPPTSLYVMPKDSEYVYPGFLNATKHPKGIHSVCCFSNPNTRISEKMWGEHKYDIGEKKRDPSQYIQSYGKGLERGRIGMLPSSFLSLFGVSGEYSSITNFSTSLAKRIREKDLSLYYRYGVTMSHDNLLECMSAILLRKNRFVVEPDAILNRVLENIDEDIFNRYPFLRYVMRDTSARGIRPLQNYMEYLMSERVKIHFTVLPLINQSMEWLQLGGEGTGGISDLSFTELRRGLNVWIVSMSADSSHPVLEKPVGYMTDIPDANSIILFKKERDGEYYYEPIIQLKVNDRGEYLYKRTFEPSHPVVIQFRAEFKNTERTMETSVFETAVSKKTLASPAFQKSSIYPHISDIIKSGTATLSWFMKKYASMIDSSERLEYVVDGSDLVVGVILYGGGEFNTIYVPIYPSMRMADESNVYIPIMDVATVADLPTISETLQILETFVSRDDCSWMRPSVILLDSRTNAVGFMTVSNMFVPFSPISAEDVPKETHGFQTMMFDFYDIERTLIEHRNHAIFAQPLSYSKTVSLLSAKERAGMKVGVADANGIISAIHLPLSQSESSSYMMIPVLPEKYDPALMSVVPSHEDCSFAVAVKEYSRFYSEHAGRIPCRITGVRVDTTKNKFITSIFLETGHEVRIHIGTAAIHTQVGTGKYLIHQIRDVEDPLSPYQSTRYVQVDKESSDRRIHYMNTVDYKKASYERFRFEISRILKIERVQGANLSYSERLRDLLTSPSPYSVQRDSVTGVMAEIVGKYVLAGVDFDDDVRNAQMSSRVDETRACASFSKAGDCTGWCAWEQGQCRLHVDKERIHTYTERIVDELVRNRLKRNELLNSKVQLVRVEKGYYVFNGEVFYDENDIREGATSRIYERNLRNRLQVVDLFTVNSSSYEKRSLRVPTQRLMDTGRDSYQRITRTMYHVPFQYNKEQGVLNVHETDIPSSTIQQNPSVFYNRVMKAQDIFTRYVIGHSMLNTEFTVVL